MKYKLKHNKIYYAVATSQKQRSILINVGIPKERTCVIHNGLPIPQKDYQYRPLDTNLIRISTMGYISSIKNQHIGVQLISMLRERGVNAVLNLYGVPDGDNEYNNNLHQIIEDSDMQEYVYYKGFVQGEKLFSETDILISFSSNEGFGRSLVEGMLRKIPVIAFRGAGGPVDITNDGQYCHLVDTNVAEAYMDVIITMLSQPDFNKENVLKSYEYAMKMFTDEVMIVNYSKLFCHLFKHNERI